MARAHAGGVVAGDVASALGRLASRGSRDATTLRLSPLQQWCIDVSFVLRHCDKRAAEDELVAIALRTRTSVEELRARALISAILVLRLDGKSKRGASGFARIVVDLYEVSKGTIRLLPHETRDIYNRAVVMLADLLAERSIGPELPIDAPARRESPVVFERRRTARATLRVGQILHRMAHHYAKRRRDVDGKPRERRAHCDTSVPAL